MVMSTSCGIFWGEIAPCEHLVQIYQEDASILDSLEGFVAGGLRCGDGVVVIATPSHAAALEDRLRSQGIDIETAQQEDRLIVRDAEECLDQFMVAEWPDADLFNQFVTQVLERAGRGGRRVRAFGEMVALLWAQGNNGATVRLEHLWHELCRRDSFSLLCAYPRSGFTKDAQESIRDICAAHSKVLA
jgi:hypothetical protein